MNTRHYTAEVWVRNDAPNPPLRIMLRGEKIDEGAIEREIMGKMGRLGWAQDEIISVHVGHGLG